MLDINEINEKLDILMHNSITRKAYYHAQCKFDFARNLITKQEYEFICKVFSFGVSIVDSKSKEDYIDPESVSNSFQGIYVKLVSLGNFDCNFFIHEFDSYTMINKTLDSVETLLNNNIKKDFKAICKKDFETSGISILETGKIYDIKQVSTDYFITYIDDETHDFRGEHHTSAKEFNEYMVRIKDV